MVTPLYTTTVAIGLLLPVQALHSHEPNKRFQRRHSERHGYLYLQWYNVVG